jgi:hypothetical protein
VRKTKQNAPFALRESFAIQLMQRTPIAVVANGLPQEQQPALLALMAGLAIKMVLLRLLDTTYQPSANLE